MYMSGNNLRHCRGHGVVLQCMCEMSLKNENFCNNPLLWQLCRVSRNLQSKVATESIKFTMQSGKFLPKRKFGNCGSLEQQNLARKKIWAVDENPSPLMKIHRHFPSRIQMGKRTHTIWMIRGYF